MRIGWLTYCLIVFLIHPTFSQQGDFPYKASKVDYAWLAAGGISYGLGYYFGKQIPALTLDDVLNLDANSINGFDRSATSLWNANMDNFGEIGKYSLFIAPAAIAAPAMLNKQWNAFFTYGLMYFETALLTTGITELTKSLSQRTRPFFYNESLSLAEKQRAGMDYGQKDSFFSGHSAIAFASAVFLSKTYTDVYGTSGWSKLIWAGSLTLASATAISRYQSGQHFPTDIMAGAVVGGAMGYLIPMLHTKKGDKVGVIVSPGYFNLSCTF